MTKKTKPLSWFMRKIYDEERPAMSDVREKLMEVIVLAEREEAIFKLEHIADSILAEFDVKEKTHDDVVVVLRYFANEHRTIMISEIEREQLRQAVDLIEKLRAEIEELKAR